MSLLRRGRAEVASQRLSAAEDRGLDTCMTCPRMCRWACPVAEAEARESTSPHNLVVLSALAKRGRISAHAVGEFPYHCTMCGACTEACLHQNEVPFLMTMARERVLAAHAAPVAVTELCGRFGVAGNPQGAPLEDAVSAMAAASGAVVERGAKTVYFPGCSTLSSLPDAGVAFLRACGLLGLPRPSLSEVSALCCGLPLLWAGDLEGFAAHGRRFVQSLGGVERLIVHDAGCAMALRAWYPRFGVELRAEVVHVVEFLEQHLSALGNADGLAGLRRAVEDGAVAYGDTCAAARGLGLVSAPRDILQWILGEAPRECEGLTGREVDCCGASGLLPLSAPETSEAMARNRIESFRASGASALVVCNPRCAAHLKSVDPTLPIFDLSMLLAKP